MNNDLISRSALLDALPKIDEIFSFEVRRVICNAPAVDAVEVVRCKDCRFSTPTYFDPEAFKHCVLFCKTVNADFFCAGGERKMDAEVHNERI